MMNIFHSLRTKLICTMLIILGMTLLIQAFYLRPTIENHEMQEFLALQEQTISNLNNVFEVSFGKIIAELEAVTELAAQEYPNREKLDRLLSEMNSVTQFFNYYFVVDAASHFVSYPGRPDLAGEKLSDDSWVTECFAQKKAIFLDVHLAKPINQLVSGFAAPFYDKTGEPLGLVRGVILVSDNNALLQSVRSVKLGKEGYAYIVDSKGRLIAHPDIALDPAGFEQYDYSHYAPVQKTLKGEKGVVEYDYNDAHWIASYRPISLTGWGMVVQQPQAQILSHAKNITFSITKLFVISLTITAGFLIFLTRHTLLPLVRLTEAIRTGSRCPSESFPRDEVGLIATQFNIYRERLEELVERRTEELTQANEELKNEIAGRQQMEKVLQESKDRYQAVVEDQTELICRFIPDCTLTFVNRAYCQYFQKQEDQLIGVKFFPLIPEEDHEKAKQCIAGLTLDAPVASVSHRVMAPFSKNYRWMNWTNRAIFGSDGQILEYQAVGSDITTRKEIEIALRLSEECFRSAFETAAHGIALVGLNGVWLRVNEALCQIVGYSEEELLQTNFQTITHPDDLETDLAYLQRLIDGESQSYQRQKRYFHKSGHPVWIMLSVSLVRDEDGKPIHFVSQIQDITARKKAEEELKYANAEMEKRIQKRTAELASAYDTIHSYAQHQQQIKEQERRLIAREIHDELGQSLTGLKMGLVWLHRKISTDRPAEDLIEAKIMSLSNLVNSMVVTVQKISRELRPGLLDNLGLIAALEWHVKEFNTQSDIFCSLTHNVDEDYNFTSDVSTALYRICQESLTNISRHAEATQAKVVLEKNGNTLRLTILDNGKGITPEQIANPQSFGLIGVKERVFPFGGTIEIAGETNKGTSVIATIPIETAQVVNR